MAEMWREGIDCSHVVCDATQRTGFQFKGRVTDGSDPPVEYHRKGSAASQMGAADLDEAWLRSARHLHATGVFAADLGDHAAAARQDAWTLMRAAGRTSRSIPTCAPPCGPRPSVMRQCDQRPGGARRLGVSGHRGGPLFNRRRHAPKASPAFTANAAPSWSWSSSARPAPTSTATGGSGHVTAFRSTEVIDTVGAGDGFAVGVISALLEGRACPKPCGAAPGSARAPCRCWATPKACRPVPNWTRRRCFKPEPAGPARRAARCAGRSAQSRVAGSPSP